MTKTITDETLKSLDAILSEAADLTQSRGQWERIKRVREELAALAPPKEQTQVTSFDVYRNVFFLVSSDDCVMVRLPPHWASPRDEADKAVIR